jgi:hypothetical protein
MSRKRLEKRVPKKRAPPSAYVTMPHYYPTEQVDIVKKIKLKGKRKR